MSYIPTGYHTVTPYLKVRDAAAMFDFYKAAFNAVELMRVPFPDGPGYIHCEVRIGDSPIMFSEENEKTGMSPRSLGTSPASIMLYVEDADAVYKQAIAAGAKALSPMEDKEYGRSGGVKDPSGYSWWITTHKGH